METTIIYDTYVSGVSGEVDQNYGTSPIVNATGTRVGSRIKHPVYYWGINMDDLITLETKIRINKIMVTLKKRRDDTTFWDTYYPQNLTMKFDLYSLTEPVIERDVTWSNLPKIELIKENFLSIPTSDNMNNKIITLDFSPHIDSIKNGVVIKMNDFIVSDIESKYDLDYLYKMDAETIHFYSGESANPPITTYFHGEKPISPEITKPSWGSIINKKETPVIRFEWDSVAQTNYEFEYSQDNNTWTKLEGTTAKFVNLATSGLTNGSLYARVKIKLGGLWSNHSQTWFLQIGEKPNTPIVSLLGITTSTPTISWNANLLQKMYQVQVLQGSTIIVDSGEIQGTLNQYILKSRLEDSKPYTFKVRIADEYNIWSDWGTKASTVNFIKPPIPTLSLYLNPERGSTIIKIQNPTPGAGEELTVFNDIFRKEGNGEWLRIATNIISEFNDLTIKPKSEIYYKVRAIGQNGYVDSTIKGTEFPMKYSDLSVVGELEKHVKLKYNDRKQQNSGYTGSLLVFSGRNKPVVEFDDSRTNDIALEFEITNKKDLDMLQDIVDSRKTLLYRDSRGRKLYGSVISKLNIQDSEFNYYTVGFTFTETDFNEVV